MINVSIRNGWLHFMTRVRAYLPSKMEYQADSVAATVAAARTDFNALLTKLKDSGAMESS